MAYRRSLCTRATLLARHRFAPSFSHIHLDDDRNMQSENRKIESLLQNRYFGAACRGQGPSSQFFVSPIAGSFFIKNMSTTVGEGAGKVEYMTDVAEVLADRAVEAVTAVAAAPAVNEIAIAAADSAFPVAALQYLIDGVHSFTGFNWWASIVVTTLLIRGATVPLLINQLKSTTKSSPLWPDLEEFEQKMQDRGMDPIALAEVQQRMEALVKEYLFTLLTNFMGLLFQVPIFFSFFLAISNMVEKVPSFKHDGAYWFTDLTTPDSFYIFPALAALTFWVTVECNMQEGMEGLPAAKTMKNVSRVVASVIVPFAMIVPKAWFCYWLTSMVFSLMFGSVLEAPGVKKFLGFPTKKVKGRKRKSKQKRSDGFQIGFVLPLICSIFFLHLPENNDDSGGNKGDCGAKAKGDGDDDSNGEAQQWQR